MPSFCEYKMCHNLGSSTFLGYCNVYHMERGLELERKEAQEKREQAKSQMPPPQEKKSEKDKK